MDLTQQIVDGASYEGRSYVTKSGRKRWTQHVLWDDRLPGFGLRISSRNRKSFIVSYREDGRKRTRTLGTSDELTLEKARAAATELLDAAAEQPAAAPEPPPVEGVETVAQLATAYLEKHLKVHVPSWFADQRLIRTHIQPAMGRAPLAEVTQMDLASLNRRIGRRFPADARRLKALLSGMFDWAEEHGLWSRSRRKTTEAGAAVGSEAEGETAAKAKAGARVRAKPKRARLPPAKELAESLRRSEEQRRELAERLEEVSSGGVEMLAKLTEQATEQRRLEAELARSRRELERLRAETAERPDAARAEKQTANLRQSVEQLMTALEEARAEKRQATERLAAAEARARAQSDKVASLSRLRSQLEDQAHAAQREAAIRKAQRRGDRRSAAAWLTAGLIGGILVTLLGQRLAGPGAPAASRPADGARPAIAANGGEAPEPVRTEPPATASPAGTPSAPIASTPAATAGAPITGGTPAPDPAAADEAVLEWAAAWSEQRVEDYLAAYAADFQPPRGLERAEWAAQRRERILRPASIRVTLGALDRTVLDAGRVRISFEQSYETETYADKVTKTLELVWEDGDWKIAAERVG